MKDHVPGQMPIATAEIEHPPVAQAGLADTLRLRTHTLHVQAERSGIINDILRGRATRYGYALLLRNLVPAYRSMEAGLERCRPSPILAAFACRELYRAQTLEADLSNLAGAGWSRALPLLPAGAHYGACVAEAARDHGVRLIGHAYARYLGDLSGGRILQRLLGQTLGLGPRELTFYEFPQISDAEAFKVSYRAALDRLAGLLSDTEPVVLEAVRAFELNVALSRAVQEAAVAEEGALSAAP